MKRINDFCLLICVLLTTGGEIYAQNMTASTLISNEKILPILKEQLSEGANQYLEENGVEMPKEVFTDDELKVVVAQASELLHSNGYQFPTTEDFNTRIKQLFGRQVDMTATTPFLYLNFLNPCNTKLNHHPNDKVDNYGTYVIKGENFITDFYYLPQLLDYKKKYPDIASVEHTITPLKKGPQGTFRIETWNSLEQNPDSGFNLKSVRNNNIQVFVARNKYLFNKDKSQLPWLWKKDKPFLVILVKGFGVAEDKQLIRLLLADNQYSGIRKPSDATDLGSILWHTGCNGQTIINELALETIRENITPDSARLLFMLSDYLVHFANDKETPLSIETKAKIIAQLLYFGQGIANTTPYQDRFVKDLDFKCNGEKYKYIFMGKLAPLSLGTKYAEEFRKNNFYGLAGFEQWWNTWKKVGDGIQDDGNKIPNY